LDWPAILVARQRPDATIGLSGVSMAWATAGEPVGGREHGVDDDVQALLVHQEEVAVAQVAAL
jgi:hypothetical protein